MTRNNRRQQLEDMYSDSESEMPSEPGRGRPRLEPRGQPPPRSGCLTSNREVLAPRPDSHDDAPCRLTDRSSTPPLQGRAGRGGAPRSGPPDSRPRRSDSVSGPVEVETKDIDEYVPSKDARAIPESVMEYVNTIVEGMSSRRARKEFETQFGENASKETLDRLDDMMESGDPVDVRHAERRIRDYGRGTRVDPGAPHKHPISDYYHINPNGTIGRAKEEDLDEFKESRFNLTISENEPRGGRNDFDDFSDDALKPSPGRGNASANRTRGQRGPENMGRSGASRPNRQLVGSSGGNHSYSSDSSDDDSYDDRGKQPRRRNVGPSASGRTRGEPHGSAPGPRRNAKDRYGAPFPEMDELLEEFSDVFY